MVLVKCPFAFLNDFASSGPRPLGHGVITWVMHPDVKFVLLGT
jgi:hypothetical protein